MSIVKFPAAKPTKRFIKICKYNVSLFRVQTESENNWVPQVCKTTSVKKIAVAMQSQNRTETSTKSKERPF